ncbi:cysteine desulfurase [Halanaerobium sp. MA284_MarDTE_T2]|uniref:cysteine desulfurase n=1 Tax=Halanaerobium sp. MA284_MarDTE_T2 TaxID=2183913 RepID=UPI000DF16273|nr:cysteine desulfurase [Halanaerobium sp. MA284_MarDTE_T2]RCW48660.1 cysteine desulfurase [Halanaerobium sp. MA284_MarDTE_T2]
MKLNTDLKSEKFEVEKIINDFPILKKDVNGKKLHYLDNAATTQKPLAVLDEVDYYNKNYNANPHRGAHFLSVKATEQYEDGREKVREFINADSLKEIVFTRNTTESINLIANSFGEKFLQEGDEIILSIAEHHSNIIPWQRLARKKNLKLKYLYVDNEGRISLEELKNKITDSTRLISITHMSNVTGVINPVKKIAEIAHQNGIYVLADGAQAVPHMEVDVQDLDVDFYAFSGHKMLAPMGIGVLYGKKEILTEMPPFILGGGMIEYVEEQQTTFAPLPERLEAGTQNVEGVVGLSAAVDYLSSIGLNNIAEYERDLTDYALKKMKELPYIEIYGPQNTVMRGGIISFNIKGVHSHDLATIVDSEGVALRSGHHCAQPLMKYLDINSSARISFYLYNDREDIDVFINSIKKVREMFDYGS